MTSSQIVCFAGMSGCGKSTAADAILHHRPRSTRRSLADSIKWECAGKFDGRIPENAWWESKDSHVTDYIAGWEPASDTLRTLLIEHGAKRKAWDGQLVWVQTLWDRMHENILSDPAALVVVDDVRFPYEVEFFLARGATIVTLLREAAKSNVETEKEWQTALLNVLPGLQRVYGKDRVQIWDNREWSKQDLQRHVHIFMGNNS